MASQYRLKLGDEEHELEVEEHEGHFRVRLGDTWHPVELERLGDSARYSLLLDQHPYDVFAEAGAPGPLRGRRAAGQEDVAATADSGEWVLTSPMAGVVQEVMVQPGDEVEAGQAVVVIEAMKMQNDLHVRRAGTVKAVYVSVGQRVEQGTPLLVLL